MSNLRIIATSFVTIGFTLTPFTRSLCDVPHSIPFELAPSGKPITNVRTDKKVVALTFDDGPVNPYTEEVLDILKKHKIKATFFVTGQNAQHNQDIIRRIYDEGHEIGNHTWSHPQLTHKSAAYVRQQIDSTDSILRKIGYKGEIHFRSPYALKPLVLPGILKSLHKEHILFDVDPSDWKRPSSKTIAQRILTQVHPGSIILLHDGGGDRTNTVGALKRVICTLSREGYGFVKISDLLTLRP